MRCAAFESSLNGLGAAPVKVSEYQTSPSSIRKVTSRLYIHFNDTTQTSMLFSLGCGDAFQQVDVELCVTHMLEVTMENVSLMPAKGIPQIPPYLLWLQGNCGL